MISKWKPAASKDYELCHLKMYLYKHCLTLFAAKFSAAWAVSGNENCGSYKLRFLFHFTWGHEISWYVASRGIHSRENVQNFWASKGAYFLKLCCQPGNLAS